MFSEEESQMRLHASFCQQLFYFQINLKWNDWQTDALDFKMTTPRWWEMRASCLFGKVWDGRALLDVQGQTGLSIPNSVGNGETAVCVFSAPL